MAAKKIPFKTAYQERERVAFETEGESVTQQHFAEETKINNIIAFHDRTGIIKNVQKGVAQYGDFTLVNEYRDALDMIREADEVFMELPSEIRKQFNNNAGDFLEFAGNPENSKAMVEMGLANAPIEVANNLGNTAEPAPESVITEE